MTAFLGVGGVDAEGGDSAADGDALPGPHRDPRTSEAVRQRRGPPAARPGRRNDGGANPGPASGVLPPLRVDRRAAGCCEGFPSAAYRSKGIYI